MNDKAQQDKIEHSTIEIIIRVATTTHPMLHIADRIEDRVRHIKNHTTEQTKLTPTKQVIRDKQLPTENSITSPIKTVSVKHKPTPNIRAKIHDAEQIVKSIRDIIPPFVRQQHIDIEAITRLVITQTKKITTVNNQPREQVMKVGIVINVVIREHNNQPTIQMIATGKTINNVIIKTTTIQTMITMAIKLANEQQLPIKAIIIPATMKMYCITLKPKNTKANIPRTAEQIQTTAKGIRQIIA